MSLARVKTWIFGERLNSADLNNEFNNILNNPVNLISPSTGAINFAAQAHSGIIPSAITTTSGSGFQSVVGSTSGAGFLANMVGSKVKGLRGSVSSQIGTFNADQYVFQTTAGHGGFVLNSTSDFVVNLGTAGPVANGRDVAAVFASTHVHWYAISTGPNSAALAGIVSSNPPPTGPVMPTGYPLWTYLGGSVYTSSSTTVALDHHIRGGTAYYNNGTPAILLNGASTTEATITLTTAMPSNTPNFVFNGQLGVASSAGANFFDVEVYLRTSAGASNYYAPRFSQMSTTGATLSIPFHVTAPNVNNQVTYLLVLNTATSATLSASVISYAVPNGDG